MLRKKKNENCIHYKHIICKLATMADTLDMNELMQKLAELEANQRDYIIMDQMYPAPTPYPKSPPSPESPPYPKSPSST
jgi:hypothetical protein